MSQPPRPDYGIDAPGVIRNLAVSGAGLLALALASALSWIPRALPIAPGVRLVVAPAALPIGIALSVAACWMYWGSTHGKFGERDRLLDRVAWTGTERVLDVGCGRGLLLVGAARRLTSGRAVGVDIWQAVDLSGNRATVPLHNAAIEGVADRARVCTADMRRLPFADASFDLVVSRAAIHNLYSADDRAAAVRELTRVLRPGGRAVLSDIRHHHEYLAVLRAAGCRDAATVESPVATALAALWTFGALRPNTTVATKAAHS